MHAHCNVYSLDLPSIDCLDPISYCFQSLILIPVSHLVPFFELLMIEET